MSPKTEQIIDFKMDEVTKDKKMEQFWDVIKRPTWYKRRTLERALQVSGHIITEMEKVIIDLKKINNNYNKQILSLIDEFTELFHGDLSDEAVSLLLTELNKLVEADNVSEDG